jgi:hypothetical protein
MGEKEGRIMKTAIYKGISTIFLVAVILMEANHSFIERVPWFGYMPIANDASYFLIPVWLLAICGLWIDQTILKILLVFGLFLILSQSMVISSGGNNWPEGVLYLAAAIAASLGAVFAHSSPQIEPNILVFKAKRMEEKKLQISG